MDVTTIPFNALVGLSRSDNPRYLLMLQDDERYTNHLGTVHASAMFALAEAASGMLLGEVFGEHRDLAAVVRKVETKFRNPGRGAVWASASLVGDKETIINEIADRGRGFMNVAAEVFDAEGKLLVRSEFEWFATKIK